MSILEVSSLSAAEKTAEKAIEKPTQPAKPTSKVQKTPTKRAVSNFRFDKVSGRNQRLLSSLVASIEDHSRKVSLKQKVQAIARIAEIEGQDITNFLVHMNARWHEDYTDRKAMSTADYKSLSTAAARVIQARTPGGNETVAESDMARDNTVSSEYQKQ